MLVATAVTENVLAPASAMLHSLLQAAGDDPVDITVLHDGELSADGQARVTKTVAGGNAALRFLEVPADRLDRFPSPGFPRAIWCRALLPELLADESKVLYLDADTVVVDSPHELWRTDLGDAPLAAVANPLYRFMHNHPRWDLGIEDPRRYLNSGVLLMNLEVLRREDTAAQLLTYARAHPDNSYPDQDAMSVLFADRHVSLHPRWNAQPTLWDLRVDELPFSSAEVDEARRAPGIVHFVGPFKPWHYLCTHPYRGCYFDHLAATPWAPPDIEGRTPVNAVLRRLSPVWISRWYRARDALVRSPSSRPS
jgi:lipopolysaccharide biosynthesis glycosyltransferase